MAYPVSFFTILGIGNYIKQNGVDLQGYITTLQEFVLGKVFSFKKK